MVVFAVEAQLHTVSDEISLMNKSLLVGRMFWLTLSTVLWFSYETLANWHCSLFYPLFYKDHSARFCTPSPE